MNAIPADTTVDAVVKQTEILRRIGISGRAKMTFELSENLHQTVEAGVMHRHPDWDEQAVRRAVVRLMIGERLFREVFGDTEAGL